MKQFFTLCILLTVFWLGLSGYFTTWLLGLGAMSLLLVIVLTHRQQILDHSLYSPHLLVRLPRYWWWLFREIIISNLHITRIIWQPRMDIDPKFCRVACQWQKEMTRVIHANSITLTPGTTTVDMDDTELVVHCLTEQSAASLDDQNIRIQLERLEKE